MMFFYAITHNRYPLGCTGPFGMCNPWIDIFDNVSSTPNKYHMQKFFPREVDVSTSPIGDHKPFGVLSSGVRVLDV